MHAPQRAGDGSHWYAAAWGPMFERALILEVFHALSQNSF